MPLTNHSAEKGSFPSPIVSVNPAQYGTLLPILQQVLLPPDSNCPNLGCRAQLQQVIEMFFGSLTEPHTRRIAPFQVEMAAAEPTKGTTGTAGKRSTLSPKENDVVLHFPIQLNIVRRLILPVQTSHAQIEKSTDVGLHGSSVLRHKSADPTGVGAWGLQQTTPTTPTTRTPL